jgi:hypothetical protein
MMENRTQLLDSEALSGILTLGGTILGTSRDKPYAMPVVAACGDRTKPVPLKDVVGKRRTVPLYHYWIESARSVHTCFGD